MSKERKKGTSNTYQNEDYKKHLKKFRFFCRGELETVNRRMDEKENGRVACRSSRIYIYIGKPQKGFFFMTVSLGQ